jgi:glyoxylase-like metal-dependent hydrolase (beta-lactamase superfamily II)/rhodanese-related sulfurtransferase
VQILGPIEFMKHPELNVSAARSTPLLRAAAGASGLLLRQCFDADTGTYTYLLADPASGEGVLIDPVFSQHGRDLALIRELGIALVATLDTHVHADHVSGAWLLQRATGCAIGLAERAGAENVTLPLVEGDRVRFGGRQLAVLATPGHTDSCLTFVLDDQSAAFTGDALLIRGCGRCDFQQGDARTLYRSITSRIFPLPEACLLYPGHDYSGRTVSSVAEEKAFNARLGGSANERDFVGYLENMQLPHPGRIAEALPANLRCGRPLLESDPAADNWAPVQRSYAGLPELEPAWVAVHRHALSLVDVRGAEEFDGPDGHLAGSLLIPLPELQERLAEIPLERPVVLLCHSGCRSALATQLLLKAGRDKVANLRGGLRAWEVEGLALEGVDRGAG